MESIDAWRLSGGILSRARFQVALQCGRVILLTILRRKKICKASGVSRASLGVGLSELGRYIDIVAARLTLAPEPLQQL